MNEEDKKDFLHLLSDFADGVYYEFAPHRFNGTKENDIISFLETKKEEWEKQLILDLVVEFNEYDHPIDLDTKYIQGYLLEKLNERKSTKKQ